jgi:hypothetical protein
MALATQNKAAIQNAPGHLYIMASPTAVVGVTTAAIIKELFGKFLVDGDIRGPLLEGILPWAVVNKDGYKEKISSKELKSEPNAGSDNVVGYEYIDYTAEITIEDDDVAHLKDVMSASAAQVLALVASATQAGRSTIIGGGQRFPTDYMFLYRYPSKQVPGEFIHTLVPVANFSFDTDREKSRGKIKSLKLKITAKDFDLLLDPTTGLPTKWLEDYVTNPKTA